MAVARRTNDEWRALIDAQRGSGLSQTEWCKANGINKYTLRDRVSKLKKIGQETAGASKEEKAVPGAWVEVTPCALPVGSGSISIERGGYVVRIGGDADAVLLTEVLKAVGRACC